MKLFLNTVKSSVGQIILFAIIPFIWWFVTARNKQSFFKWLGLKKFEGKRKIVTDIFIISILFTIVGAFLLYSVRNIGTATSKFDGLGVKAIPAITIHALFNTSFPEELLFRGYLLKRLSNIVGFNWANLIQAILFGFLHGVMFFAVVGILKTFLICLFTSAIAWFMGYINEKEANGSIIPSWIIHAIANLFSGIYASFSII